jgi:hypothetical protein
MSTTVTNTNPITITGGTMASGARATIYPGQIARSFKVMKVEFITATAGNSFVIKDNSSAGNVLCQGTATATNTTLQLDYPTGVSWGDWKVTTLSAADTLLVYIK